MIPMNLILAVLFLLGAAQCLPLSDSADADDSADTEDSQTIVASVDDEGSEALVSSDDADKDLTKSNLISPDKTNSGLPDLTQNAINPESLQLLQQLRAQQGSFPSIMPALPAGFGVPAAKSLQSMLQPQPAAAPATLQGLTPGLNTLTPEIRQLLQQLMQPKPAAAPATLPGLPVGLGLPGANPLQSLLQPKPAAAAAFQGINPAHLASLLGGQHQAAPPKVPQAAQAVQPRLQLASPPNSLAALLGANPLPGAGAPNPIAFLGGINLAALGQQQPEIGALQQPGLASALAALGQQQPALGVPQQPDLAAVLAGLQAQGAAGVEPNAEDEEKFGMWGGMGMYNPMMWMYG